MGLALATEEAHEYGIALSFAVLGTISLVATCIRWVGMPDDAKLTKVVRFLGSCVLAPSFLIISVIWIVGNRGTEKWSRIPGDWTFVVNSYVTSQYPDLPVPDKPIAPVPPIHALDKPRLTTSSVHPRVPESHGTTEVPPPVTPSNKLVQLSAVFKNPSSLSLVVFNPSDDVAENVSWAMVAFRTSDLAFFGFQTQSIGYIKPHMESANYFMELATMPKSTDGDGQIKEGDELTGSVSIDCPKCTIRTYLIHVVWKREGWYFESPLQGGYILPKDGSREGRARYIHETTGEQYVNQRIEVRPQ
jgi:hypothetical protein